ncbi:ATP12 family chaperone protein [Maritalea mediterranea]|uniref:ATPase n=1 Tax=Maritalea mediterranea TaxID=2909667 RepID=A0ABS9E6Z8_9HYPH|nr:ATP12 family protein [Maritalea mediterranea]MCF4098650.1 ATPase [Maritalea mediterranea]
MREILKEAEAHIQDGYGRAQEHAKQPLPKRFYKEVSTDEVGGKHRVLLDGKPIKTPGKKTVEFPDPKLAQLVADEWAAAEEKIDPSKMPLTRLCNTIVESGEEHLQPVRAELLKYAGSDLLFYRADGPDSLVALQRQHWDAPLEMFEREYGAKFELVGGVMHVMQPQESLDKIDALVQRYGLFSAFAAMSITSITGSALLAIGLREGHFESEQVWTAAYVDENYQASQWGEDEQAMAARAFKRQDYDAAVRLFELLNPEV